MHKKGQQRACEVHFMVSGSAIDGEALAWEKLRAQSVSVAAILHHQDNEDDDGHKQHQLLQQNPHKDEMGNQDHRQNQGQQKNQLENQQQSHQQGFQEGEEEEAEAAPNKKGGLKSISENRADVTAASTSGAIHVHQVVDWSEVSKQNNLKNGRNSNGPLSSSSSFSSSLASSSSSVLQPRPPSHSSSSSASSSSPSAALSSTSPSPSLSPPPSQSWNDRPETKLGPMLAESLAQLVTCAEERWRRPLRRVPNQPFFQVDDKTKPWQNSTTLQQTCLIAFFDV